MTERELRRELYGLVAEYFAPLHESGSIVWGKTKHVKPSGPSVTLHLLGTKRPSLPNRSHADGIVADTYPAETTLNVDLFTKGAPVTDDPNVMPGSENTAANDLMGFASFLNSHHVERWSWRTGVALRASEVMDLTALTHGSSWTYRALLEVGVRYMQAAAGHTGTNHEGGKPLHPNGRPMFDDGGNPLDAGGARIPDGAPLPQPTMLPDSSGGGHQALADKATGYFTDVEIENKTMQPRTSMPKEA